MGRTILVLGGGGVKGMAHIGAWKAVQEAGIEVSEIVGTSIGALVGACVAGGMGWDELAPLALRLKKSDIVRLNRWALLINGIRQPSVFHDHAFRDYIRSVLPVTDFSELALPLSMNAVDLETGKMEWFGAGGRTDVPLADAIYASCALPVFYPPAEIGGRHLVDGGVGDSLPVRRAAERGADLVIAVDVGAGEVKDALDTVSKGIVAIQHRVFDILSYARRRQQLETWDGPPLIYIRPRLDGYSTFDFGRTRYFLEEGYRAAREALADWSRAAVPAD
ncbi:MAG: patatin-like phospholipase family protein [bacterium]|jgi:NTE family protein